MLTDADLVAAVACAVLNTKVDLVDGLLLQSFLALNMCS